MGATLCCTRRPVQHWTSAKSAALLSISTIVLTSSSRARGKQTGHCKESFSDQVIRENPASLFYRKTRIKRVLSNSVRFVFDSVKKCRVHQWCARHIARI